MSSPFAYGWNVLGSVGIILGSMYTTVMMTVFLSTVFDFNLESPFIEDIIADIIQYWLVLMALAGALTILIYGVITKKVMPRRQVVIMVLSGVGVILAFMINSWVGLDDTAGIGLERLMDCQNASL